jgi:GntR family transcriptional regulator / MocR family aminotransferase
MPQPSLHTLGGSFSLDRESSLPLQDQIAQFFRSAIADERLAAGKRVPSSREFAAEFGISRTTAVGAYDRLVAEGYFSTRRGAGVFVAQTPPDLYTLRAGTSAPPIPGPADFTRVDMRNYLLPLAPGMPAIDKFPWSTWNRLSIQVCRERPLNAVGYGDPQGELSLRLAIVEYLAATRGIACDASQIIVMAGSEQSLEFVLGHVGKPGDAAWVENPGAPYIRSLARDAAFVPTPVPVDQDGMDVAQGMDFAPDARLAIVSPTHQYPTGATLSMARRHALVEWSESNGSWILESEIDGDYRYAPQPLTPLYALSKAQRVFYCGSLSKPLAPGLRTNYLVVPADIMQRVSLRATLVPMLTQVMLARFNSEGYLAQHMRRMRTLYARRRSALLEALREQAADYLLVPRIPDGGLRVATTLRHELDDTRVARLCLAEGIKVDPVSVCHAGQGPSGLIIGFASTPEEQIPAAVAKLVAVLRREVDL